MRGFGDPSAGGLGFGDPEPLAARSELGFGDPDDVDLYTVDLDTRELYHTGGAEVMIKGLLFDTLAPYRAELTVNNAAVYLQSGEAGQGAELFPERGVLYCYAPPVPVGVYPLILRFGPNYGQSVTLSMTIKADNRGAERYRLRELFPAHYQTGPRASSLDPLDRGAEVQEEGPLALILDTVGRVFQEITGAAETIARTRANRGATSIELETSLGFAESGRVWIGRELISYTLNSAQDALTVAPLKVPVRKGERILHHAI